MKCTAMIALGGATVALALSPTAALAAGGTKVTVRIEGSTHTLLAPRTVQPHTGFITKDGASRDACPAYSAAGALGLATKNDWTGKFYTSFNDYLISSILGDAPNSKTGYWGVWVDNRFSEKGVCEITPHRGQQLLFAVDSVKHHEHPLGVSGPRKATAGHPFTLKVVSYSDSGHATPLAGAHVRSGKLNAVTNARGVASVAAQHTGKLTFTATDNGYIRSAPVSVRVSS